LKNITKEFIEEWILANRIELSATHSRLCIPIIRRIYKKMSVGIQFTGIKVTGNIICDGHHRYIASLLANYPIDRIAWTATAATLVTNWDSVLFIEEDWDTPAKISMLNEQDAMYNSMSLEQVIELLK
jgi:hypothetical protein